MLHCCIMWESTDIDWYVWRTHIARVRICSYTMRMPLLHVAYCVVRVYTWNGYFVMYVYAAVGTLLLASNKYLHMFCGVIIYVYFVCTLFVILDIDCWLNGCALILNSLDL